MFLKSAREFWEMEWRILQEGDWEGFREKGIFKISLKNENRIRWVKCFKAMEVVLQGMEVQEYMADQGMNTARVDRSIKPGIIFNTFWRMLFLGNTGSVVKYV